jgi:hypothetical protein
MEQVYGPSQFVKEHGDGTGNDFVYHNGRYICPDGAMCSDDGKQRWLPSPDPTENRAQRRYYLLRKLEKEIADWDAFKNSCLQQAQFAKQAPSFCPPPSANSVEQLKRGQQRIAKLRKALADLDAEIAQDPKSNLAVQQVRADQHHQRCSEIDELVSEIVAVEI